MLNMQMTISKVENSAQVSSCTLKFVHARHHLNVNCRVISQFIVRFFSDSFRIHPEILRLFDESADHKQDGVNLIKLFFNDAETS